MMGFPVRLGASRGFTLVELLVVMAIVALLIALMVPTLAEARATARAITCLNHARQLYLIQVVYAADQDDAIPPHTYEHPNEPGHHAWLARYTAMGLIPAVEMVSVSGVATFADPSAAMNIRFCPEAVSLNPAAASVKGAGFGHFSMLQEVTGYGRFDKPSPIWAGDRLPLRMSDLPGPGKTTYCADSQMYTASSGGQTFQRVLSTTINAAAIDSRWKFGMTDLTGGSNSVYPTGQFAIRHRDSTNFVFFDGHGERRQFQRPDIIGGDRGGYGRYVGVLRGVDYQ